MPLLDSYDEGSRLFRAGQVQEAVALFAAALREHETSDRWNDWAAASLACGRPLEAERGFRSALEFDAGNGHAAANLGALLAGQSRLAEAIPMLESSVATLGEPYRAAACKLLDQCRSSLSSQVSVPSTAVPNPSVGAAEPQEDNKLPYFFHIPKTSGMSFYRFLICVFGEANVSPPMIWDALPPGATKTWKVWAGHFGGLLPFVLHSWPRMVSILRDPVDRTLSHINHVRRAPDHPLHGYAQGKSVLEYCRHHKLRRTVDNYQSRYLASLSFALAILKTPKHPVRASSAMAFEDALFSLDRQHDLLESAVRTVSEMEMVGIAESHLQTLQLFSYKFNGPAITEPFHENIAGDGRLKRSDLSPDELACIQEMTQIDQAVYENARRRFELDWRLAHSDARVRYPALGMAAAND